MENRGIQMIMRTSVKDTLDQAKKIILRQSVRFAVGKTRCRVVARSGSRATSSSANER